MRIIISPAKKMNREDALPWRTEPCFLGRAEEIRRCLREKGFEELRQLWGCNEKLAELNFERVQEMELDRNLSPAILCYEGLQYQYMAPKVMSGKALEYLQRTLRILSGFYGVLRPFDGIVPYRLEMQAKLSVGGAKDLYAYWGAALCRALLADGEREVLNLASKEYSRAVEPWIPEGDVRFVSCVFAEEKAGRRIQKATLAKMARGEMVRFLAEQEAESVETAKKFMGLGFCFDEAGSDEREYLFLKRA